MNAAGKYCFTKTCSALMKCGLGIALAVLGAGGAGAGVAGDEFGELRQQLANWQSWDNARLQKETLRGEALILGTDRSPVDVVWRRTWALAKDLQAQANGPSLGKEVKALEGLRGAVEGLGATASEAEQRNLFRQITALRRQIAFKNPLLDFSTVIFLKHNKEARGYRHMVDQYLGFNAEKAGGVYVLRDAFTDRAKVESVLNGRTVQNGRLQGKALENAGGFIGLELDYDGESILFAFTEAEHSVPAGADWSKQYCSAKEIGRDKGAVHHYFRPESTYHIFRARKDGSELRQLTDGMWNDFDPVFLPSGRIAFISERAGGQVRCGMRPLPTGTLHAMMPDGSDIIQLSYHDTQEWHPSVDNNGMIAYTRWDYVDRDSDVAQHLWTCYPDGRDPRSVHGNYPDRREARPWMEMSIRAIPGSQQYVGVAAPHHGEAYGSIVVIDPAGPDDRGTAQLKRVTPEVHFPESESAPGVAHAKGKHTPRAEVYGTPWPLSRDYYLCVYDAGQTNYALCLLDAFGNREILYRDAAIACLDPIPLRARARPAEIPRGTMQAAADRGKGAELAVGTVAIANVYQSESAWPAGIKIKEVRVVNIFPKDNPFQDDPHMGYAQALGRGVLGVAPVETDGSAHFQVPAGAPVYFQLLDERGLAVQTMRSDTYVHPGETLTCAGCHESRHERPLANGAARPLAWQRSPSVLRAEVAEAYPITFPRLVQPVLEAQCVPCHTREAKAPGLRADRFDKHGWSEAYQTLRKYSWGMSGGNGMALKERQYSVPGQDGARVSKLYQMLAKGHHEAKLSAADLRRITIWLDCNSLFYGAYTDTQKQARGELVEPRWGVPRWTPFETLVHGEARKTASLR